MKIVFTLFHYFPYGGLERDMLAMARACKTRGHEVVIYTQNWQGELPSDLQVVVLPVRGGTNHGRAQAFARAFTQLAARETTALVVGFNKMPGLDVYFAADTCFAQKVYEERGWFYRWSSRSRTYLALERAVFDPASQTQILLISPAQQSIFQRYYQTPAARLQLLPPGIRRDRIMPADYAMQRQQWRARLGVTDETYVLLMVGSDFKRKGLARSLRALAMLPLEFKSRCQLWVAGQDGAAPYLHLAKQLGVAEQFCVLGARDDIPALLWSADVLLHPAHSEAAGAVLLEAMVAGLPVITSDVCGYAHYVESWQLGRVLDDAEVDDQMANTIVAIAAIDANVWRARAQLLIENGDVFSMMEKAVAVIETVGASKCNA